MTAEKTRRREVGSLEVAMVKTGIKDANIITLREATQIKTEHGVIEVIPAWKWSLESVMLRRPRRGRTAPC